VSSALARLLRPRPAVMPENSSNDNMADALKRLAAEDRRVKDAIAGLCKRWRQQGPISEQYARELETAMGWQSIGDPLTGCLPAAAPQTGLDRVQDAVRRARGGEAPTPPQGYA